MVKGAVGSSTPKRPLSDGRLRGFLNEKLGKENAGVLFRSNNPDVPPIVLRKSLLLNFFIITPHSFIICQF